MRTVTEHEPLYRPAGTGRMYWGPGVLYTFLVTGAESAGAYFAMEARVRPRGGPPPHVHRNEDETYYVVDGRVTFQLGDRTIVASRGDYVHVPRGNVHAFLNATADEAKMVLTFTPAGIEQLIEQTLQRAYDPAMEPPEPPEAIAARYAQAAPRYGTEYLLER